MKQLQNDKYNPSDVQSDSDNASSQTPETEEEIITLEEIHKTRSDRVIRSVSSSGKIKYRKKKHKKHGHHKESRKSRILKTIKKVLIGLLIALLVIILGLFITYQVIYHQGKNAFLNDNGNVSINTISQAESDDDGMTVTYKGEKYKYNDNIVSIVFLGVDKSELGTDNTGKSGQADAIYIFTYDIETGKCCLIPVSRETMTDVAIYTPDEELMGYDNMQLCLAYAYGDGKKTSCENTLASLSRVFYNIPFNNVVSLNWDAIAPLNDVVGGVSLTSLEDINDQGIIIHKDEKVTLLGKDAWMYVKYRNISELKSNTRRLDRQKQYINTYMSQLIPMAKSDFSIINNLLDIAKKYMYTNLSTNKLVYTASEILPNIYSSQDIDFVSIKGTIKEGEQYAEFHPDETSLYETILKVFYTKITNE